MSRASADIPSANRAPGVHVHAFVPRLWLLRSLLGGCGELVGQAPKERGPSFVNQDPVHSPEVGRGLLRSRAPGFSSPCNNQQRTAAAARSNDLAKSGRTVLPYYHYS